MHKLRKLEKQLKELEEQKLRVLTKYNFEPSVEAKLIRKLEEQKLAIVVEIEDLRMASAMRKYRKELQ